mgnify:CR=1 FL=1
MFAVMKTGGKQYRVQPGDRLRPVIVETFLAFVRNQWRYDGLGLDGDSPTDAEIRAAWEDRIDWLSNEHHVSAEREALRAWIIITEKIPQVRHICATYKEMEASHTKPPDERDGMFDLWRDERGEHYAFRRLDLEGYDRALLDEACGLIGKNLSWMWT